jgi:hypothetical protein
MHRNLFPIYLYFFMILSLSRYSDWLRVGLPRGRSSIPGRGNIFLHSTSFRQALEPTQPPIQWVLEAISPGVKRLGRKDDHSPPTSAEVKKRWIYTSTPPYFFMAYCLISEAQEPLLSSTFTAFI